jgi:hypothetical protein
MPGPVLRLMYRDVEVKEVGVRVRNSEGSATMVWDVDVGETMLARAKKGSRLLAELAS